MSFKLLSQFADFSTLLRAKLFSEPIRFQGNFAKPYPSPFLQLLHLRNKVIQVQHIISFFEKKENQNYHVYTATLNALLWVINDYKQFLRSNVLPS